MFHDLWFVWFDITFKQCFVEREHVNDDTFGKHTVPEGLEYGEYIVNTKTGKFHYPDCRGVKQMKEANKEYVTCDRQDLISQGYESCGICHP